MDEEDLLPVRGINAFVFCPRLFWLEYVEGSFLHNEHTLEGSWVHRRVDVPGGSMPAPAKGDAEDDDSIPQEVEPPPWQTRSLWLSDKTLGVTGKLDLVDEDEGRVFPVDTKKGSSPEGEGLWPADRVQLTLQALLLRAQGYHVEKIAAWYSSSRRRVEVMLTDGLIEEAAFAVEGARRCHTRSEAPLPLEESPKCAGCSLQPLCLPDEINALRAAAAVKLELHTDVHDVDLSETTGEVRRLQPARDDALPVYVQDPWGKVSLSDGRLKIYKGKAAEEEMIGLPRVSQLNLMGNIQISAQALQACLTAEIPVFFFSMGGKFYGRTEQIGSRQIQIRILQHQVCQGPDALGIARSIIADKIANQRTLLRRNSDNSDPPMDVLGTRLKQVPSCEDPAGLLGIEGDAARHYWGAFSELISRDQDVFKMNGRNRRPPRDPANAMLSFGYALLTKDATLACTSVGLDPYLGLFHTTHHGRPSLALDLMEPFRPLIVDSMVLGLIRRQEIEAKDFIFTGQAVVMSPSARKVLIAAYERRMDELITHPVFGYRISYRRVLHVQARLLTRVFSGEIDTLPPFRTR